MICEYYPNYYYPNYYYPSAWWGVIPPTYYTMPVGAATTRPEPIDYDLLAEKVVEKIREREKADLLARL
jgi:hypothetical protein